MEVLQASSLSFQLLRRHSRNNLINKFRNPSLPRIHMPRQNIDLKTFAAITPTVACPPSEPEIIPEKKEDKFEWYENWYPVASVCDLDKRRPHGRKVIGIDVVVWWDRKENAWKVFDDTCPHRLAPLSEGRIDQWGRLQCVYHGWCFDGAGACKFIPQAPHHGPPVETSKKACVKGVYPSCVRNGIVWFWPNSDPKYKDIFLTKKPHYIPELDDPSFTCTMTTREVPYGYEILAENLMDPSHVPYAHYGILELEKVKESAKRDREGGHELEIRVGKIDVNGFSAKQVSADYYFVPPYLYYGRITPNTATKAIDVTLPVVPEEKTAMIIFYCIPVRPGYSRLIFAGARNFAVQVDRFVPRWITHMSHNLIFDSDLFLLHVEERKLKDLDWHKSCYIPTKADGQVVAFRRWLNKYGGTQVDWRNNFTPALPPTPSREQLFDRYWSHTAECSSCSVACKRLNALEIGLQAMSLVFVAMAAAVSAPATRYSMVAMAVLSFLASKWLSRFIHKTFYNHGYDHAFI
uniref:Flavonoid 8-hydroxylase 2, chloroplastic n=1 Tax=Ocimum basilicum TaxID=39350 RepID=F8H2_OCIBA|nr:RecName: Full=Flavonoid 8-hydroxylase 2, chloroplastic; Short=ObF8H-2; Flags: Precursor [Ocimum basilicum]AII16848.1 flavone 8-hydroxylase [Ocimum basilicum]